MTNTDMLVEMRSARGFHAFGAAKVQRMFHLSHNDAIRWIDWLIETGAAERIEGRPWEVRLI